MLYAEISERARELASQPVRPPRADALARIREEVRRRTSRSESLFDRAKLVIPRGSGHTLPLSIPHPLFMHQGRGARVWDVDGNEYVDYILSGGAIILGHTHEGLTRSMMELISGRTSFHGFHDEVEIKAAEKIAQHFPSIDKVRFTASGSEANLAAVRIARSFTGKRKIIKFQGGYHGWPDPFMTDMEVPGSGRLISLGVPSETLDLTIPVPPNDLEALDHVFREQAADGGVAAVLVEPVGGESGLVPFAEGFHAQAMDIAHRHGALYVFDEVVTGLRMGLGGAQEVLGVRPDLTTLGKALMNGYPSCGAVAGKAEIMETAATGLPDGRPYAYIAGTLSGNLLSVAAAYHTILELEKPGVMEHLFRVSDDLVRKLNGLFEAAGTRFFAYNFGGIVRIEMTSPQAVRLTPETVPEMLARRGMLAQYALVVQHAGVLSRMGRDMISVSHTAADNDRAVEAYGRLLDTLA
jgi:glutamate-1-semialdehyde 2,1-aminomutase